VFLGQGGTTVEMTDFKVIPPPPPKNKNAKKNNATVAAQYPMSCNVTKKINSANSWHNLHTCLQAGQQYCGYQQKHPMASLVSTVTGDHFLDTSAFLV